MPSRHPALHALRSWLNSWSGIGLVAVRMHRQGYDLQLTQSDERGWRATFYTTGMEHSPTSATGTAWERTPWHARLENLVAGSDLVFACAPARAQWLRGVGRGDRARL